ncbi:glucose-6-phosphate dehydrogenase [Cohnella thailandensis]|uniref:Glucose-6-phosphate 1-dehydrogenase n=1 Tax=Cohnella thailandensis TaxID=557557 RepID=A0A841T7D1_9BACL|nr:glucose-6-phosphate dehydrogenase [Cohnella thailandensis]MBB6637757.1 glucose-6-phosphate dehydrogenase [Cohnella thailandensis]MBP1974066.1 glucose-6-phosphate 1-dehydrogenase [Cohnella thailandensis]
MEATTIVLFGATGDLAKRKIYPALYNLFVDGKLPEPFSVFGLGRREWSDAKLQENVEQSILTFSRRKPEDTDKLQAFLSAFRYSVLDVDREEDYKKLLDMVESREEELGIPQNRLFYLSVGPEYFKTIAYNIKSSGLGTTKGWKRLVIEKPFGHDLASARDLNEKLSAAFTEDEIFRIDHYLGKPVVQKMEMLQHANPVLQAFWTNRYIANVQITANETVGVEERAGYYDKSGAIRDMFQNHMLQLLMMLAIHLPSDSGPGDVRARKKEVVEALVPVQAGNIASQVVRGQYAEGSINGKPVAGYTSEPGIAADSRNDTFVAARLEIDNYFWRGVPIYIRTGKRLKEKSTRIVIEFKEPLKSAASKESGIAPNLLVFEMAPNESITLQLNTRDPGGSGEFKPMNVDLHTHRDNTAEAYENLIHDAFRGDATFFAHWDEVERSWQWVEPILNAFANNEVPLRLYEAGSYGPKESDELLAGDGFHWWFDDIDAKAKQENQEGEQQYAYHANH